MNDKTKLALEIKENIAFIEKEIAKKKLILEKLQKELEELDND